MSNFLYRLRSKITGWFGDIKVYKYPFFIIAGPVSYKIKGEHQRAILNCIQPGDILLRRYDHYISGLIIPGYFTHSALYIKDSVIHMLGKGICTEDILIFMRCDDIAVLRHPSPEKTARAIKLAKEQLEKKTEYDFAFDFDDSSRLSCTELIQYVFEYPKFSTKKIEKYVVPDDLKNTEFEMVWEKGK